MLLEWMDRIRERMIMDGLEYKGFFSQGKARKYWITISYVIIYLV